MPETAGILGGTFNPIHIGHLLMAEYARCQLSLDSIIFIPNNIPPHKKSPQYVTNENRFIMASLATVSNNAFLVSRIEFEREVKSYTYDTIIALQNSKSLDILKKTRKTNFVFICGADSLIKHQWYKFPNLLEMLHAILVAPRNGLTYKDVISKYSDIPKKLSKKIIPLEMPHIDISSSLIRDLISQNKSIKYLVPEPVENYINKYSLYQPAK